MPVDAKFPTYTSLDVQVPGSDPADLAYASVVQGENVVSTPAAPAVTDEPEVLGPLRPRSRVDEYGLRDPFGRVDQRLVQRAQVGTSRLPGTGSTD
jgi:hypothetical protein